MTNEAPDNTLEYPMFAHVQDWRDLPQIRRQEVVRFLDTGILPQGFVYELLCDNFVGAVKLCPDEEISTLPTWAKLITENMPMAAHGNKIRVESYARHRRDLTNDGSY